MAGGTSQEIHTAEKDNDHFMTTEKNDKASIRKMTQANYITHHITSNNEQQ